MVQNERKPKAQLVLKLMHLLRDTHTVNTATDDRQQRVC
jgi:hypothetical protein